MAVGAVAATQPAALGRLALEDKAPHAYAPGDRIAEAAFVQDRDLGSHVLRDLVAETEAKVNVLYIYGGGAYKRKSQIGGIWCRDSFEDLYVLRFLHEKYHDSEVRLLPVACPPVYGSDYYGFRRRVFLDFADDAPAFTEAARAFVASTEEAVARGFVPVDTYYDFRNRLLFNRRADLRPGEAYGPIHAWQGRFRSDAETQKYGTPTLWLLDAQGRILEKPFHGNLYHAEPYEIRYTLVDVDRAIRKRLE